MKCRRGKRVCGSGGSRCRSTNYRLLCPRAAFLILALFSPRAPVRGALGAAFLREARLSFLRSALSVTDLVFAIVFNLSFQKSGYVRRLATKKILLFLQSFELGEFFDQLLHA